MQCGCGWGKDTIGTYPNSLQEVKLIMQEDQMCESHLHYYYTNTIQLCMGDPKTKKASLGENDSLLCLDLGRRVFAEDLGPGDRLTL